MMLKPMRCSDVVTPALHYAEHGYPVVPGITGAIESVGLHKPTLEDVFLRETGAALW